MIILISFCWGNIRANFNAIHNQRHVSPKKKPPIYASCVGHILTQCRRTKRCRLRAAGCWQRTAQHFQFPFSTILVPASSGSSGKRNVVFREQLEAYLTNCCANLTPVWQSRKRRQRQRQRREQVLSQHLCAGNFTTLAKNETSLLLLLLLRSTQAMLQIIRHRYVQCAWEQRSLLLRRLHQDLKSSSKDKVGE